MHWKARIVFLSLIALVLVTSSLVRNGSVSAQGKPKQRNAVVVLGPTGTATVPSQATGVAYLTISDQNVASSTGPILVARIEINGMPTGLFATHIHEGFCPPPMGPEPDQQGPIRVDFNDTVGFNLDNLSRSLVTVSVIRNSNLPTRAGGVTSLNDLLDSSRNFYLNVHQRANSDPGGIGPGLTCGRVEFK